MKKHTPVLLLLFFALLGCSKKEVDIRDNFAGVYNAKIQTTVVRSKRENNFYLANYNQLVTASKSDNLRPNEMYLSYSNEKYVITVDSKDFVLAPQKTKYPIVFGNNQIENFDFDISGTGYFTADGNIYFRVFYRYANNPAEKDNFYVDMTTNGTKQ